MTTESSQKPVRAKSLSEVSVAAHAFKKYKILADFSPGMIDVYEYATGQYVYVNLAVEHVLGYKREEMLKGGLEFLISRIHPDDVKKTVKLNNSACKSVAKLKPGMDDTNPFASIEYRVMHKKGHWVWLKTDASVYSRTPEGMLELIINTCVDITKQKEAETTLRELSKKLSDNQVKLKAEHKQLIDLNNAKDDFISIASHQLRTPATGVKQYVGMLLEGYAGKLTEPQLEMLKIVNSSNERQIQLINDLLKIVQIDAGKVKLRKSRFDMVRLFKEIKTDLQDSFQVLQQDIVIEYIKKPVEVRADESFIRMVAENLIDNASKFSNPGRIIKASLSNDKKFAIFSITDKGIGISRLDQKKLFKKFSRVENSLSQNVSGSGLGLYWAKKIVDLHGGSINVNSRKGKGATFTVKLPLE